jgi:hypothetical protein
MPFEALAFVLVERVERVGGEEVVGVVAHGVRVIRRRSRFGST